jgi:hypothetical protein
MKTILVALAALGAGSAHAAPKAETFGAWTIRSEEVDTGEDLRKACAAQASFVDARGIGGTLSLDISNGDALPPYGYPALTIAVDNKDLPGGKAIAAVFGDDKGKVEVTVHASSDAGGQWMVDNQTETSHALLRAMRRASALDISFAGKPVATVSMDGFGKAYRGLGVRCGFPTGDVAP